MCILHIISALFIHCDFYILFFFFLIIRIQVTITNNMIMLGMEVIWMQEKLLLSIMEASQLFGIGQNRLREIVRDDYNGVYHLMVGRVIKIKRKPFEEYLNKVQQI